MSNRVHHARLISRRTIARSTEEFLFRLENREFRFKPGHFLSVPVGIDKEGNPILRSYSIASPPWRLPEIVFILKLIEGGVGSRYFDGLHEGEDVRFTGPHGYFVNDPDSPDAPGDRVYVGTGTGIAPLIPMAEEALLFSSVCSIHLYFGVRTEADLFYVDELQGLCRKSSGRMQAHLFVSQPGPAYIGPGSRGRLTGPLLELVPGLRSPIFYLCGNGQMIEEVKERLQAQGIQRKRQIRTEAFFD